MNHRDEPIGSVATGKENAEKYLDGVVDESINYYRRQSRRNNILYL